jgi:hypothetical protein
MSVQRLEASLGGEQVPSRASGHSPAVIARGDVRTTVTAVDAAGARLTRRCRSASIRGEACSPSGSSNAAFNSSSDLGSKGWEYVIVLAVLTLALAAFRYVTGRDRTGAPV